MLKILLIDDDKDQLGMFKLLLENSGDNVVRAISDPKSALRIIEEDQIDVVICDMMMPEINGKELLAKVKEKFPETKCMLFSAAAFETANDITIIPKANAKSILLDELSKYEKRSND